MPNDYLSTNGLSDSGQMAETIARAQEKIQAISQKLKLENNQANSDETSQLAIGEYAPIEMTEVEKLKFVHDYQPNIILPQGDTNPSGQPFELQEVLYSVKDTETETHVTYIYKSNFCDTPWLGEKLGYSDHD